MIHLRLRTEYSLGRAFGRVDQVLEAAGGTAAAITDNGTWGHTQWAKAAAKRKIKPLFGVEVAVVPDITKREHQPTALMALIARRSAGLSEMYRLVTLANENFYYMPRLDYHTINAVSDDLIILSGANADLDRLKWTRPYCFVEMNPSAPMWNARVAKMKGLTRVVCADNLYPSTKDRQAYEIVAFRQRQDRTTTQHIPDEDELRMLIPMAGDEDFLNTERIAAECDAVLPRAQMVRFPNPRPLREMCLEGAARRGLPIHNGQMADATYQARLDRELAMIEEKQFHDYFYVIADLVQYAKQHMLVGPARGSSCGSLVCYLLAITDVDPIVHDLMFERFIDINRADLPDIDIDFQDTRREMVYEYLQAKYGADRVGRIGTVLRYKAKSALGDVAKALRIPEWEIKDVKGAMIERSSGDARAQYCVMDTLETMEKGKELVKKYPKLALAGVIEGHATTSGKHAAGMIVTEHPLTNYCAIGRDGTAQIDKKDAEQLNILKIDALGLRTLSVLQDCLDQIGKDRDWLVRYPLDDAEAFEVFNAERWTGIFQYEGLALQLLARQMKIHDINDVIAITALARPGPLHCGAATEYVERRVGKAPVVYIHPLAEPICQSTYGTIIYQEQVMAIGRAIGQLTWEEVSELRKAMSKSLGEEFFNQYWERFKVGADANGIESGEARRIWDKMCTFGSWAFNKSHAVAYGLISYWCAVLKAHWPLEYAAACLRSSDDETSGTLLLRELVREGYTYQAVDPDRSSLTWSVINGQLIGGLTTIKGMGPKKAEEVLRRRKHKMPLTPGLLKMLTNPVTPYDDLFPAESRFGDLYRNPRAHNILSGPVSLIRDIHDPGEYVFIGRLLVKNLRDMNEYQSVVKRNGRLIKRNNLFLILTVEDDTGNISCRIDRYKFKALGKPIVENAKEGDWFLWKGAIRGEWRQVIITKWRRLEG